MLTGKKIAIVGGDARQLEIIKKLSTLDAGLLLIGFENLSQSFQGAEKIKILDCDFSKIDSIILPVSGTNKNGEVETVFSNERLLLTERLIKSTPEHCKIYSGISNDYLDLVTTKSNRQLIKLFDRDDIAIYNSIPTAEGTIMMVIKNTDITIHSSKVVIVGFGRVGMSVARAFHSLGADVKVGARRSEHLARITEMGFKPFHIKNLRTEVKNIDVCINTVPKLIVNSATIANMPLRTLIIDLASKPGGTDFRFAKKRGINAILAPGLPGIVAPKTAGEILAKVLAELLKEDLPYEGGN